MNRTSIRDFLYEPPGPKTRRAAAIGTAAAIAGLILLLVLIIRQFYIRRTLPLTLQGCLMRRRNAADVWSIRQCLYARYMCRTQVRLPGIFAGNVV